MFLELIATFAAGIGAAGFILALNLLTKGRLPKWAMPVAAGGAMLAATVGLEMGWGARTTQSLPDGVIVVETAQETRWWKPWTFVSPQIVRIIAADTTSVQTNEAAAGILLVDLYLFARWQPTALTPQLIDCATNQRADPIGEALLNPSVANWRAATPDLIAAVCKASHD